jgi:putative protease
MRARAAAAGATEVVFDPFVRHPAPPVARVRALADELAAIGVVLRLRTPTVVRPAERRFVDKWLAAGFPLLSGHLGLVAELGGAGRDVVADYAVNAFNEHTAAELFALGARPDRRERGAHRRGDRGRLASVGRRRLRRARLRPARGDDDRALRALAAFDRVPTTCRDLCVQKHTNVELTDPRATPSGRHRLGVPQPAAALAAGGGVGVPAAPVGGGIRGYHLVFNVAGDPVADIVARYPLRRWRRSRRRAPTSRRSGRWSGAAFTRGHFARAV